MAFDFYGLSDTLPATYCGVCRCIHYEITILCARCYRARQNDLSKIEGSESATARRGAITAAPGTEPIETLSTEA